MSDCTLRSGHRAKNCQRRPFFQLHSGEALSVAVRYARTGHATGSDVGGGGFHMGRAWRRRRAAALDCESSGNHELRNCPPRYGETRWPYVLARCAEGVIDPFFRIPTQPSLVGLREGIDLLPGPRVVGMQFENLAVVGNGFIDLPVRLVRHGEQVVRPHRIGMIR